MKIRRLMARKRIWLKRLFGFLGELFACRAFRVEGGEGG